MGPKPKSRRTKAETEEERNTREEEERKQREIEAKRLADEAEKKRIEDLRIQMERISFRTIELAYLDSENITLLNKLGDVDSKMKAETAYEVLMHSKC